MSVTNHSTSTPASLHQRELDEVSIASDFSVIPESLVEIEVGENGRLVPGSQPGRGGGGSRRGGGGAEEEEEEERNSSTTSFLRSTDLHISSEAMEHHSKVQFHKLQPNYYLDSDIPVSYNLGPNITPVSSDRIGLYKVGFATILDYVDYLWAPVPTSQQRANNLPLTVVFKASGFQKEQHVGEFFQFCYVTHGGEIVGVSGPFQLLHVGAAGGELCGVEEEEMVGSGSDGGMVVIRSKESVLQEKLVQLSQEREQLQTRSEEAEKKKEEAEKKVEEQAQQLSLCQHHLQALEVKLKRETSEKCELMGRVGQVVEERGHLEERVRGVEKALAGERGKNTHLEEALAKSEGKVRGLEEAALVVRKSAEEAKLKVATLEKDLGSTQHSLKDAREELERAKGERERAVKELEFWASNVEADQQEKNSLALKYSTVTEELIAKQEELEENRKKVYALEERLQKALEELDSTKTTNSSLTLKVEELEEEHKIHVERDTVVRGDLATLKERLATLEEEQKRDKSGREAAETIACDLSSRLQAAKAEYQRLAVTNHRLVKKVKKMRTRAEASISISSSSGETDTDGRNRQKSTTETNMAASTTSWICADMDEDEEEEEEEEEAAEVPVSVGLTQSTHTTLTTPSCCSHTTQQLSEVVNQKMEDIVRELSQQIMSLKLQLEEKERVGRVTEGTETEERDGRTGTQHTEAQNGERAEIEPSEVEVQGAAGTSASGQVLYGKSFLPTAPTAPVFLPERPRQAQGSGTPQASPQTPNVTPMPPQTPTTQGNVTATTLASPSGNMAHSGDPTPAPRAHYYHPHSQTHPVTLPYPATSLPPPLLPESTPMARHVAVLSQFSQQQLATTTTTSMSSTSSSSTLPTAPPLLNSHPHDSDDDDFHSTDSDTPPTSPPPPPATAATTVGSVTAVTVVSTGPVVSSQPQHIPGQLQQEEQQSGRPVPQVSPGTSPTNPLLNCPMCSLCFPLGAQGLLLEHINSHLEHVCPVCSQAFQRNCKDKFMEHVHAHFPEEDEEAEQQQQRRPADNAGPWGDMRNGHLLEID